MLSRELLVRQIQNCRNLRYQLSSLQRITVDVRKAIYHHSQIRLACEDRVRQLRLACADRARQLRLACADRARQLRLARAHGYGHGASRESRCIENYLQDNSFSHGGRYTKNRKQIHKYANNKTALTLHNFSAASAEKE